METRRLGTTDMELTRVGVGAWAIGGGGWAFAWGEQDDSQSIAAIHRALDRGVNWIDTAAVYGLGHSEEVVARALAGMTERPWVFTKCSQVWNDRGEVGRCLKADSIRRECEDSLRRLQVDVIDLYQIHWPDPDEDVEEGWRTMCELRDEGKIRWAGVSNFSVDQLRRAQAIGRIDSLQPPYSLVRRGIEAEVLPFCRENDIGVIVYSPMASGVLSGGFTRERAESLPADDWRSRSDDYREPKLSRNLELVDRLRAIADRAGTSPGAVAIGWTLRNPAVTAAIVGFRRPDQVDDLVPAAARVELTDEDVEQLESAEAAAVA